MARTAELPELGEIQSGQDYTDTVSGLVRVIQETIAVKVPRSKPSPYLKQWWSKELEELKKKKKKVSSESCKYRALAGHPSHKDHRKIRREYGHEIERVKKNLWIASPGCWGSSVWSGPRPFLPDRRLDSLGPDEISGTRPRTAWDHLYQSGPSPDPVQTVPGSTFIPGHIDAVRGCRGGRAGGEVVGQHGLASNPSITSSALFSAICPVATNGQLWDSGGGGAYVEEAADGANHEAGLVEACDTRGGTARGAADDVYAEELHVGHGAEQRVERAHLVWRDLHTHGEHRAWWGEVE